MRRAFFLLSILVACGEDLPPMVPPPPPTAEPVAALTPADTSTAADRRIAPPTKTELRTATLKAFVAATNAHDATKIGAAYAADATLSVYGQGGDAAGTDAIVAAHQAYFSSFGDLKLGMRRVWQNDAAWAVEWAFDATQSGPFMTLPANGASVGAMGLSVLWFDENGLITREHRYFDSLTLRDQIKATAGARVPPAVPDPPPETHVPGLGVSYPEDLAATAKLFTVLAARDAASQATLAGMLVDDPTLDSVALEPGPGKGKSAFKEYAALLARAMPDGKLTSTEVLAADHFVVSEYDLAGTLRGAIYGVTPSQTKREVHGASVVQWRDGKVLGMWMYANRRELLPPAH